MKLTIDRIEGDIAVCEASDMQMINLPISLFEDPKEGDVYIIEKDESAREEQMSAAKSLFEKLKNRG